MVSYIDPTGSLGQIGAPQTTTYGNWGLTQSTYIENPAFDGGGYWTSGVPQQVWIAATPAEIAVIQEKERADAQAAQEKADADQKAAQDAKNAAEALAAGVVLKQNTEKGNTFLLVAAGLISLSIIYTLFFRRR